MTGFGARLQLEFIVDLMNRLFIGISSEEGDGLDIKAIQEPTLVLLNKIEIHLSTHYSI